jgi:Ca-activated chloride channel family protein
VAVDRNARVRATPTTDHPAVAETLSRLTTGPGTATGDAIGAALSAIDAANGDVPQTGKPSAAIVLLSDGVTTVGQPVEDAATAAADEKVPVTTIAFGTESGTVDVQGRTVPVPADTASMTAVAEATGGRFFQAASAKELRSVYADIGTRVGYSVQQHEIGMTFVAIALVLLLAAVAAALVWTGRIL